MVDLVLMVAVSLEIPFCIQFSHRNRYLESFLQNIFIITVRNHKNYVWKALLYKLSSQDNNNSNSNNSLFTETPDKKHKR